MSGIDAPSAEASASESAAARGAATSPPGVVGRVNGFIRRHSDRLLNLWSLVTIALVATILIVCVALWDIVSLRPVLATAGAGLAAFLGPIPGIISPEIRSKWLVTIIVSALIAAATWFATKDLESQLHASERGGQVLGARVEAQREALFALLEGSGTAAQDALYLQSGRLLKAMQHEHKYQDVLDLALPMLKLRPDNGTALAFAGYAYRRQGELEEAKKKFENYIAVADGVVYAAKGAQQACYERVDGFCAERTGWVEHLLAGISLTQAEQAAGIEKLKLLEEAFEHEKRNVELPKWQRPGKDQGFDANDEEPRSSCTILQSIATSLVEMGKSGERAHELRRTQLNCG